MKFAILQRAKAMYEAGRPINEIAREIGYGMRYLQRHMLEAGYMTAVEPGRPRVYVKRGSKIARAADDIKRMAGEGASLADAAAFVGCSYVGLHAWARRNGVTFARAGKRTAKSWSEDPRAQRMATMYRQGLTLEKIGAEFNVTRERVRQVITKCGAARSRLDMLAVFKESKAAQNQARIAARIMEAWGVDRELHHELRANGTIRAFEQQKQSSSNRGITWALSFAQWYAIWQASGKLHLRGRGKGRYCMSRIRDEGGYVLGNVHVQLSTDNSAEAVKKWAGKSKVHTGVYCLYAGREMAWLAQVGRCRLGFFPSIEAATAAREAFIASNGFERKTNGQIKARREVTEAA